MIRYSSNIGSCLCQRKSSVERKPSVEDYLRCAPCPPPMMSLEDFLDHARQKLLIKMDACIISNRCFNNKTALASHCPPSVFDCPEVTTIPVDTHENSSSSLAAICIAVSVVVIVVLVVAFLAYFLR
jgi:hypothetical protein